MDFKTKWYSPENKPLEIPTFQDLQNVTGQAFDDFGNYVGKKEMPKQQLVIDKLTQRQYYAPEEYSEDAIRYGKAKIDESFKPKDWYGMTQIKPNYKFMEHISAGYISTLKSLIKPIAELPTKIVYAGAVGLNAISRGNFQSAETLYRSSMKNWEQTLDKAGLGADPELQDMLTVKIGSIAGQTASSLLMAAAVSSVGGLPAVAAVFGSQQFADVMEEGLAKGLSHKKAVSVAFQAAVAEGGLEAVGFRLWSGAASMNKSFRNIALGFLWEGAQEGSQQIAESAITNFYGLREQDLYEIMAEVALSALVGGLVGGVGAGLSGQVEQRNIALKKEIGMTEKGNIVTPNTEKKEKGVMLKPSKEAEKQFIAQEIEDAKRTGDNKLYNTIKHIANTHGITEENVIDKLYPVCRKMVEDGATLDNLLDIIGQQVVAYKSQLDGNQIDKEANDKAVEQIKLVIDPNRKDEWRESRKSELEKIGFTKEQAGTLTEHLSTITQRLSERLGFDITKKKEISFSQNLSERAGTRGQIELGKTVAKVALNKNADPTTVEHEFFHYIDRVVLDAAKEGNVEAQKLVKKRDEIIKKAKSELKKRGIKDMPIDEEILASAYEKWLWQGGKSEDAYEQRLFNAIREFFREVYDTVKGLMGIRITPEADAYFRAMTGESTRTLYQFAGPMAETADRLQLSKAEQMLSEGKDAEEIRKETGWFKGVDGKWRFEISDKDAKLKVDIKPFSKEDINELNKNFNIMTASTEEKGFLFSEKERNEAREKNIEIFQKNGLEHRIYYAEDILSHEKLFSAYPNLKNVIVRFETDSSYAGSYDEYVIKVNIQENTTPEKLRKTLLHELQHAIQEEENFARGGNPSEYEVYNSDIDSLEEERLSLARKIQEMEESGGEARYGSKLTNAYRRAVEINKEISRLRNADELESFRHYKSLAGEIEARNVETRADMAEAERVANSPESTQDIKNADAIVVFDDGTELSYTTTESPNIYYQPAYHGSAAKFDRFDVNFMGTGEGAQAHGWGLYFAGTRETAEGYRERLSTNGEYEFFIDGKKLDAETSFLINNNVGNQTLKEAEEGNKQSLKNHFELQIKEWKTTFTELLEDLRERKNFILNNPKLSVSAYAQKYSDSRTKYTVLAARQVAKSEGRKANIKDVLSRLEESFETYEGYYNKNLERAKKFEDIDIDKLVVRKEKGQLYEVNIPDNDVLLDENKNFDGQPKKVQEAINKLREKYPDIRTGHKGLWIYKDIVREGPYATEKENKRWASETLNEYGVKGITYYGAMDGRCYVIFDDKAIEMLNTFYQQEQTQEELFRNDQALKEGAKVLDKAPTNEQVEKELATIRSGRVVESEPKRGFGLAESIGDFVLTVRQRVGTIDKRLKYAFDKLDFNEKMYESKYGKNVVGYIKKYRKLDDTKKRELDYLILNKQDERIREFVRQNDMLEEYNQARTLLDNLYVEGNKAGMDMGFLQEYFPTKVVDPEGLITYLKGTDKWTEIERALAEIDPNNQMSIEDRANAINNILRGYNRADPISKQGFQNERLIFHKTPEMMKFYAPSDEALMRYVSGMSSALAIRNAFNVKNAFNAEESIGGVVQELIKSGQITYKEEAFIRKMLKARLNYARTAPIVALLKNFGYLGTMNNITSAVTQIGDLYANFYKYNFGTAMKALFGKREITKEDLHIDSIWEEFADAGWTGIAVNKLFSAIGLNKFDKFGKETAINGAWIDLKTRLKNNDISLLEDLSAAFGSRSKQVMEDIKNNNITEDVKLLIWTQLADTQPLGKSGVPVGYLNNPHGRIIYQLKTYTINQLSLFYADGIYKINKGLATKNKKLFLQGVGNTAKLALLLTIFNAGADALKNLIMGRKIDISDTLLSNMLWNIGVSKYTFYRGQRDGYARALLENYLLPPQISMGDDAYMDIKKIATGKRKPSDTIAVTYVPFGRMWYWWFGGGRTQEKKKGNKPFEVEL